MLLYLYITNADDYLDGNIRFHATNVEVEIDKWMLAGTVEFDSTLTDKSLLKQTIKKLDAEHVELRASFQTQSDDIENRKQKLLNSPHLKAVTL